MCRQKKSFFVPTPEEYVDSVIRTIGKETVTFGTIPHLIMVRSSIFQIVKKTNDFIITYIYFFKGIFVFLCLY